MRVTWNQKALDQLDDILEYGRQEFGVRTARQLFIRIMSYEPLLAANPKLGKTEPLLANRKRAYRSIVAHRNFKLIYYVEGDTVYIANLWDTRREPTRLTDMTK